MAAAMMAVVVVVVVIVVVVVVVPPGPLLAKAAGRRRRVAQLMQKSMRAAAEGVQTARRGLKLHSPRQNGMQVGGTMQALAAIIQGRL